MSSGGAHEQSVSIPGTVVDDRPRQESDVLTAPGSVADGVSAGSPVSGDAGAEPPVEAPAEKKKTSARSSGMAAGGQPVGAPTPPPGAPAWPDVMNADEIYVPEEFDVTDLAEVNRELNRARSRIFRVSQTLKLAQRTLAEAQSDYDREMRRQLVSISGGTAESRRAMAEINCEHLENRIIVGKQVVEEWRKRSMDTRDDLKAVENIAHNVRAQIDIR